MSRHRQDVVTRLGQSADNRDPTKPVAPATSTFIALSYPPLTVSRYQSRDALVRVTPLTTALRAWRARQGT